MIASLRGTVLVAHQPSFLVVEVGGVGFKVFVPASVFDELDGVGRDGIEFLEGLHDHRVVAGREIDEHAGLATITRREAPGLR